MPFKPCAWCGLPHAHGPGLCIICLSTSKPDRRRYQMYDKRGYLRRGE